MTTREIYLGLQTAKSLLHFCRTGKNWLLASHSWTGFQFVVYLLQICCLNKTAQTIFNLEGAGNIPT